MAVDLSAARVPKPQTTPAGVNLQALDSDVAGIALAASAATLPGHVDFGIWSTVDRTEYWQRLLDGFGPCGPILPGASRILRDAAGAIVGSVVVTEMPAREWWVGGPWIPEIFVTSEFQGRGLGGLLLGHAVRTCVQAGCGRLGLTVSEGNPARHLYERFGFQAFRATWLIERPALG
jgi:GNAT superfamily N-acetyltransferase